MPLENMLSLLVFAFVTSITPGPNNLLLLSSGLNFGFRATYRHLAGLAFGFFIMLSASGLGLAHVFVAYPMLYSIMRWVGAAYLLYLSWQVATSAAPCATESISGSLSSAPKPLSFVGAIAFQWINPVAWVMAVSCFSSFVPYGSSTLLIMLVTVLFVLICLPCCTIWAFCGDRLRRFLLVPKYRQWFNWTMATLLVSTLVPVLST